MLNDHCHRVSTQLQSMNIIIINWVVLVFKDNSANLILLLPYKMSTDFPPQLMYVAYRGTSLFSADVTLVLYQPRFHNLFHLVICFKCMVTMQPTRYKRYSPQRRIVQRLMWVDAGLSLGRPGLNLRPTHVGFVVDKVSEYFRPSHISIIHPNVPLLVTLLQQTPYYLPNDNIVQHVKNKISTVKNLHCAFSDGRNVFMPSHFFYYACSITFSNTTCLLSCLQLEYRVYQYNYCYILRWFGFLIVAIKFVKRKCVYKFNKRVIVFPYKLSFIHWPFICFFYSRN
jgi:hypothetical protein